jgi:hypothetical protein
LWHLHRFLHFVKYIILKFTSTVLHLLLPPEVHLSEHTGSRIFKFPSKLTTVLLSKDGVSTLTHFPKTSGLHLHVNLSPQDAKNWSRLPGAEIRSPDVHLALWSCCKLKGFLKSCVPTNPKAACCPGSPQAGLTKALGLVMANSMAAPCWLVKPCVF